MNNSYTILYFIRHAEPDFSIKDDRIRPLTAKGHDDARQLLHVFQQTEIDRIYSSPYLRAVDTVKYLAESRGKSIEVCEDLRERKIGDKWIDDFFFVCGNAVEGFPV